MPLLILRLFGTFTLGVLILIMSAIAIPHVLIALPRYLVIGVILFVSWVIVSYVTEPHQ